jgi:hypothetical protein
MKSEIWLTTASKNVSGEPRKSSVRWNRRQREGVGLTEENDGEIWSSVDLNLTEDNAQKLGEKFREEIWEIFWILRVRNW